MTQRPGWVRIQLVRLLGLLLCVAPSMAVAQTMVDVPPVRQTVDANGVDLCRGNYALSQTYLSIGAAGLGLSYTRSWVNNGWRDSLIGGINKVGAVLTVSLGDAFESFTQSGRTYTSNEGSGSTLAKSGSLYTYMTTDGRVATFDTTYRINPNDPAGSCQTNVAGQGASASSAS